MIGAIAGDIIGSEYEWNPTKNKDEILLFKPGSSFTDDTVTALAVAKSLLHEEDPVTVMRSICSEYGSVKGGFGLDFYSWVLSADIGPYGSWGNGAAMRIAPVAWLSQSIEDAYNKARTYAEFTHNHPEGIRGAQAVVVATRMALEGYPRAEIKEAIQTKFLYDLDRTVAGIRPNYEFEVSCQKSVPEAIICFLEANNFEDCVVSAISLGGDADTLACIAGGLYGAYNRASTPRYRDHAVSYLTEDLREIYEEFEKAVEGASYPRSDWKQLPVFQPIEGPAFKMAAGQQEKFDVEMEKIRAYLNGLEEDTHKVGLFHRSKAKIFSLLNK